MSPSSYRNRVIIVIVAVAALRLLYVAYTPFGASPDEAHYWEWSRRLALSYYSKGPGVAYVIAFFTSIFGTSVFSIRLGAVVFSTAAAYLIYAIGRDFFKSEKAGLYAVLLTCITPIFSIGAILMTTDVLFLFFWALSAYASRKAVMDDKDGWWYALGVFVGLGFISKYTMVLFYPCLALFLIASGEHRAKLRSARPYMAALISLVAVTPVILWNIWNGQVTIRHTLGQAHAGSGMVSIGPFAEFLGSQALMATPLVFIGFIYGLWRCWTAGRREGEKGPLLAFFLSAPLFLFFLLFSLHGKVQANWAVASYMTAIPALAWAYIGLRGRLGKGGGGLLNALTVAGTVIAVAATLFVYFPWVAEPRGAKSIIAGPPFNRVTGWKDLGDRVSLAVDEMGGAAGAFILSDTYQITSELALYARGNPVTYNADTGARRMNQYDLWPGFENLLGSNAVYVKGGDAPIEPLISDAFDRCGKELFPVYWGAKKIKEFSIFRCYDFKGMEKRGLTRF